ncbi:TIGR03086 family metal-binding protein [Amycolatopsis sp. lyj-109]|uniref:TIGR03086 family metal-binding protein n=1 Tax=Amycolatopsis sp. lyj-109 TaxID=2789287 RepID=UPI00397E6DE7
MIFVVLDDLARVAAASSSEEQKALPTPCGGFDVQGVRRHLTGGLTYFEGAFRDPDAGQRGADPHHYSGPDELDAILPRLSATLRSALDSGVAAAVVNVSELGGSFPGAMVVDMVLIEVITHGWDLARAAGLPWEPADETSAHALAFYRQIIRPEWRGPGMAFDHEFPVEPNAAVLDRLVAFTGRDPNWSPKTAGHVGDRE